jgi:hypothetical protein
MYHNEIDPPRRSLDQVIARYSARIEAREKEAMRRQRDLEDIRRREIVAAEISRVFTPESIENISVVERED